MTPLADIEAQDVTVTITQAARKSFFLSSIVQKEEQLTVDATAQMQGMSNDCVIALESEASGAISAATDATLDAPKCAVLSNSRSTSGISVTGLADLTAGFICSAGGAYGGSQSFTPAPLLDCPQYDDPLADRTPPDTAGCDFTDTVFEPSLMTSSGSTGSTGSTGPTGGGGAPKTTTTTTTTTSLMSTTQTAGPPPISTINGATPGTLTGYQRIDMTPGVYCGGIRIEGLADVHAAPGVYVIKDGPLTIDGGGRLYGQNVGFYFEGAAAAFDFRLNSIVHITAPKSGLMAGLLMWESASAPADRLHNALSGNARELLGAIYLPRGTLNIDTVVPVADSSAYTAIIANKFQMDGSPVLVLNTNYSTTDIPTPDGVGPTGGAIFLRQ